MDMNRAIELMEIEKECVTRQDGTDCPRNCNPLQGCTGCDLIQYDPEGILEAYDVAIDAMKFTIKTCDNIAETMVNCGFTSIDQFQEFLKKMGGDHNG